MTQKIAVISNPALSGEKSFKFLTKEISPGVYPDCGSRNDNKVVMQHSRQTGKD
ncbi:MAG: hypothetical protein ACYC6P_07880 [Ignavibacteriaceae bacterium]